MRLRSFVVCVFPLVLLACGTSDSRGDLPQSAGDAGGLDSGEEGAGGVDSAVDTSEDVWVEPGTSSVDSGHDVGDPDVVYVPEAAIPSVCEEMCADLLEQCGINVIQGQSCADYCEAQMGDDQRYLASFVCAQSSCELTCFEHAPEVAGECVDFCAAAEACDVLEEMELPEDPGLCAVACAGYERSTEALSLETFTCAAAELERTCDPDAVEACYYVHPYAYCAEVCDELDASCGAETLYQRDYGASGCVESCMRRDTAGAVWSWGFCTATTTCDGFAICEEMPDRPSTACEAACDVALNQCPGPGEEGITPEELCGAMCATLESYPGNSAEGAADCVATFDSCVDDPDNDVPAYIELVAACVVEPPATCEAACEALEVCDPTSPFLDDCVFLCSTTLSSDPVLAGEVSTCVEGVSAPCARAACLQAIEL